MRKRKPKWKSDCVCSLMLTVPFMTGFFDGVPMKGKVIIECHSGCINKKLLDGKVGVVFAGKIEGKHADWQDGNWCKEKN